MTALYIRWASEVISAVGPISHDTLLSGYLRGLSSDRMIRETVNRQYLQQPVAQYLSVQA